METPAPPQSNLKIGDIPIKATTRLNIRSFLFCTWNGMMGEDEVEYFVYLGDDKANFLLVYSAEPLMLGDAKLVIEEMPRGHIRAPFTKQQVYITFEKDKTLNKLWLDEVKKARYNYKNEQGGSGGQVITDAIFHITGDNEDEKLMVYAAQQLFIKTTAVRVTESIDESIVDKIPIPDRQKYINMHINGGYKIDDRILFLGKTGLTKFKQCKNYQRFAKYRGHSLVIKNTKSGMTSVSLRIGLNISAASFASIEGFAERQTGTNYSILHGQTGFVNFDEFLMMKENMVLKMYNFLEQGVYITGKNARIIENVSCAQCVFTANPSEFEDMSSVEDIGGGLPPAVLAGTFKTALKLLTTTTRAMGSRFALIVFDPEMPAAIMNEQVSPDDVERAKHITNSIAAANAEDINHIFSAPDAVKWLETPITGYKEQVYALVRKLNDFTVKAFWEGHAEGYRHMRGLALTEAVVEHVIINGRLAVPIPELLEDAEESLQYIMNVNLTSLRKLAESDSARQPMTVGQLRALKPSYILPILHGIAVTCHQNGLVDGTLSLTEILKNYSFFVPEEYRRSNYGRYAYPSAITQNIVLEKLRRALHPHIKVENSNDEITFFITHEQLPQIKLLFGGNSGFPPSTTSSKVLTQ